MSGTFSQIYIQIVFAVKGRENLIAAEWKNELHKYIAGIIKRKEQKPIIVNGMTDHIHAFVGLRPTMAIADIARDIKNNSSNLINQHKWLKGKFSWQEGYGAFSYSHSQIEKVYNYILNQESHHKKKTFREEYIELLKSLKLIIMRNIYSNGMVELYITPSAFQRICEFQYYNNISLSGFSRNFNMME